MVVNSIVVVMDEKKSESDYNTDGKKKRGGSYCSRQ